MKRRIALKHLGFGVTAGLALPWLSSCIEDIKEPVIDYDGVVGIIGAGAAGLYAADYLLAKGIKVKIFEASSSMGGRVRSIRTTDPLFSSFIADFPLELGADRIIGSDSTWGTLVKLYKAPTVDFRGGTTNAVDKYILDDQYKALLDVQADNDFNALLNFRDTILPGYNGGGSVQTVAGLSSRVSGILNSWLGNAYGTSSDRISAQALGEAISMIEHDRKELTLGLNSMSNVLLSRFSKSTSKVQLNSAVKSVDYSGELITLSVQNTETLETTTETVGKLIVAVPVSILKAGDIIFAPSLPASKGSALGNIGMDAAIRVIMEFKRNDFFGADTAFIFGGSDAPSYFVAGSGRSEANKTFSVTISGAKAEELSAKTDLEKVQQILAELDTAFGAPGNLASTNVRRKIDGVENTIIYAVQDWTKEPFIKGGQSYPLVGGTNNDRIALAAPVGENLYFAGEATDVTGEFGTISGALNSGRRAAEELIASIVG